MVTSGEPLTAVASDALPSTATACQLDCRNVTSPSMVQGVKGASAVSPAPSADDTAPFAPTNPRSGESSSIATAPLGAAVRDVGKPGLELAKPSGQRVGLGVSREVTLAPTTLSPTQVLDAHPRVRDAIASRLTAIQWVLAQARLRSSGSENEASIAAMLGVTDQALEALAGGRNDDVVAQLNRLKDQLAALDGRAVSPRALPLIDAARLHVGEIERDLTFPNRSPEDVATRYAQYAREYAALKGHRSTTDSDTNGWDRLKNGTTGFVLETFPVDGLSSAMDVLEDQVLVPQPMQAEFDALRASTTDPRALVEGAARLVHAYTHSEEGRERGLVCRHASELTRKLIASAGIEVRIETLIEPFGHAYNLVTLDGRELLVDTFFHPAGPMIASREHVEQRGFGSPNAASAPSF